MMHICLCGVLKGEPHTPDCPYPEYGTADTTTDAWAKAHTAKHDRQPAPCSVSTLQAIGARARALGCRAASIEYPDHLQIVNDDGGIVVLGTANGPWQADVYAHGAAPGEQQPAYTITVSGPHAHTAEGIARFVLGTLNRRYDLLAYTSHREQVKGDREERAARGRR